LQDKINALTNEKIHKQGLIRQLENELRHQQRLHDFEKSRGEGHRRSSRDSGFGSTGDVDEAIERQKAMHAKDQMSTPA